MIQNVFIVNNICVQITVVKFLTFKSLLSHQTLLILEIQVSTALFLHLNVMPIYLLVCMHLVTSPASRQLRRVTCVASRQMRRVTSNDRRSGALCHFTFTLVFIS